MAKVVLRFKWWSCISNLQRTLYYLQMELGNKFLVNPLCVTFYCYWLELNVWVHEEWCQTQVLIPSPALGDPFVVHSDFDPKLWSLKIIFTFAFGVYLIDMNLSKKIIKKYHSRNRFFALIFFVIFNCLNNLFSKSMPNFWRLNTIAIQKVQ